jgi:uncharacterized protein (TIGR04255 family)
MAPTIFKKPPVVEVGISIQFPNTLEIADERGKFYRLIKAEFPLVIIPEQGKCPNDFGDYALHTQNLAERLEIGMNYFRLVTTTYPGYAKFRTLFLSALSVFCKTYTVESFNNFFYYYNNLLPIGNQSRFDELFTLQVKMPGGAESKLLTSQGTLLFQEPEGHVAVEFKPEWKDLQVAKYWFMLRFGALRQVTCSEEKDEVGPLIDAAHMRLENYFFSLLQPKYIEFLEAQ